MKLYLVRHGEALSPLLDPQQGLSSTGREESEDVARFVSEKVGKIDRIFHSPKLRAKQTAQIFALYLAPHLSLEEKEELKPNDLVAPFISEIERERGTFLIVSHLPFLASLISLLLLGEEKPPFLHLSPSSIACLDFAETRWVLSWFVTPALLTGSGNTLLEDVP